MALCSIRDRLGKLDTDKKMVRILVVVPLLIFLVVTNAQAGDAGNGSTPLFGIWLEPGHRDRAANQVIVLY